jgi:hypothetical protein
MNPNSLSGLEPIAVRGKWFEVDDHNHSAIGAPRKSNKDKSERSVKSLSSSLVEFKLCM